jgi:hypothetical protein
MAEANCNWPAVSLLTTATVAAAIYSIGSVPKALSDLQARFEPPKASRRSVTEIQIPGFATSRYAVIVASTARPSLASQNQGQILEQSAEWLEPQRRKDDANENGVDQEGCTQELRRSRYWQFASIASGIFLMTVTTTSGPIELFRQFAACAPTCQPPRLS